MKKLLYIVGPTATGKTNLALNLARKFKGDIISADSRQVYRGMDIGTGKDIPLGFKKVIKKDNHLQTTLYQKHHLKIWGYDQVNPDQDYSIAHFKAFVDPVINQTHSAGKLPIIVGGSGLYLNCIESPPDSLFIRPNPKLRKKLSNLSVGQLQQELSNLNQQKYTSLNQSDINNPRRLVRAIEICSYQKENKIKNSVNKKTKPDFKSLWIGLKAPTKEVYTNIEKRVKARVRAGFEAEFDSLYQNGLINPNFQATSSTGYRQWLEYKNKSVSKTQAITNWIIAEKQYAKRQIIWFKKNLQINWFNSQSKNLRKSVEQLVRVWYS